MDSVEQSLYIARTALANARARANMGDASGAMIEISNAEDVLNPMYQMILAMMERVSSTKAEIMSRPWRCDP